MQYLGAEGRFLRVIVRARYPLGTALLAAFFIGWAYFERQAPPFSSDIPISTDGAFVPNGEYPGKPFGGASRVRRWASWDGSDDNTGRISVGPFPAPSALHFWACGYPTHEGIEVYAERADSHDRRPLEIQSDPGAQWKVVSMDFPEGWVGKPVLLVARDNAKGPGGWIGISEPIDGGSDLQLLTAFAAFSVNALVLGILWFAAARRLTIHPWVPPMWIPLLAAAFVAVLGYFAFWAYLLGPSLGKIFSVGICALACADLLIERNGNSRLCDDAIAASKLLILIGILYVALLYFFPSNLDFYPLANGRWLKLARDNFIPHAVGSALFNGEGLHWTLWGWQTSDRPPLQSGWMLLTWVFGSFLGLDDQAAGGTSALLLQMTWVFAAYGLLCSLGLSRRRACAWVAVLSLCGFFIINSAFTWPKLSAGAFGCGVFGLWVIPKRVNLNGAGIVLGGVMAALALLSHAGVAFSFIALAPWVLPRLRYNWRIWGKALLLFLLLVLPWLAFQKSYAPPGNRLLKMHLAGQFDQDPRGTWQTITENYAKLSWDQIIHIRRANFSMQIPREWGWLHDFSKAHAPDRRHEEFFFLARALTWWLFGLLAFPIALARWRSRIDWRAHLDLMLWSLATMVIWCLVLFLPKMALLHQGSYCVPIAMFALLTTWLELASPWAILAILVLQGATFAATWAIAGDQVGGPANLVAVAFAAIAAAALAIVVAREGRETQPAPPS
jgi:hypothetical protein